MRPKTNYRTIEECIIDWLQRDLSRAGQLPRLKSLVITHIFAIPFFLQTYRESLSSHP